MNARNLDGFPHTFRPLCPTVLRIHIALPPEQPSYHPTAPLPEV